MDLKGVMLTCKLQNFGWSCHRGQLLVPIRVNRPFTTERKNDVPLRVCVECIRQTPSRIRVE